MEELKNLAKRMRADWDRRISHDYRFWMSDGWSSDEVMWQSGERDLAIICRDIKDPQNKQFLELGCGVGRLLRAAAQKFQSVTGVDVSEQAVKKASELLESFKNVTAVCGNGIDLNPTPAGSIDVLISFAALTSMPTDVIAAYLRDMQRVLTADGVVRLQVYLGSEQPVQQNDTLHVRCYQRDNFIKAANLAGFNVEWIEELKLPFEVSFKELGIEAMIVSLRKSGQPAADIREISRALLPDGEQNGTEIVDGAMLEYWMSVNYAKELMDQGDLSKARETLEYATRFTENASIDLRDTLDQLVKELSDKTKAASSGNSPEAPGFNAELYAGNLAALEKRFPDVYQMIQTMPAGLELQSEIKLEKTEQGQVVWYRGTCQDHQTKPISAAEKWVRQIMQEQRIKDTGKIFVYGMGSGYHVEELLKVAQQKILVIEPCLPVFMAALGARDLRPLFDRISHLSVGTSAPGGEFTSDSELAVRPQAQAFNSAFYQEVRSKFYSARGFATLKPRIAVLGPLYGGTLPIMGYSTLALTLMGQRVRQIDMSGFMGGYNQFEQMLQNDGLKAVATARYVEMLSSTVLASAEEKPIDILICMAQAPISVEALTELRKRGVVTVLWFVEDYLRFTSWQLLAPYYDFIFTIQRDGCIQAIKQAGCEEVHYLPTACDPMVHSPVSLTPEERARWGAPISFVGAGYHNRQQMFASMANLPFKIWGTEWPECRPFDKLVQEKGRRLTPEEYIKIFNSTDININLHSSTERDGVDPNGDFLNPRVFELAACGAFQLTDPRSLLGEVFTPGKDIVTFTDVEDLKEKINYYSAHVEERKRIAEAGRRTVLEKHTYQHRYYDMLSIIYSRCFERLKARQDAEPWSKIIRSSEKFPSLKERCQLAFNRGEQPTLDALISDIVTGQGSLNDDEMKLLFLYHVSKQIIRMKREESGA